MANREEYRFDVNASTDQAEKAIDGLLNKFGKLERTIGRINSKGFENNHTTNQKDMDKSMRSYATMARDMAEASKQIHDSIAKAQKEMSRMQAPKMPRQPNRPHEPQKPKDPRKNASKESLAKHAKEMQDYEKAMEKYKRRQANYTNRSSTHSADMKSYEKEKSVYEKRVQEKEKFVQRMIAAERELQRALGNSHNNHQETQGYTQNYSKNFDHKLSKNDIYNMPSNPQEATRRMRALFEGGETRENDRNVVTDQIKEVQRLRSRSTSSARKGSAAGYMSYQQAKNFHDDYITSQTTFNDWREKNFKDSGSLGTQRQMLKDKINDIEQNPEKHGDNSYHTKLGYQRDIEAIDEEIKHRNRLNAEIEKTMVAMQENRDKLLENHVEVDARRGTFARNMSERSAAIGLAMGGTIAGTFVNMYSQGRSVDQATRGQEMYFGQSSGMDGSKWNKWETGLINQGKNNYALGFTAQQQMQFMNDYLQNAGYHGTGDVSSAVNNMGSFSRVTGIDANTTGSFFGTMAQTGGMDGSQIKDFQDAFIGGIKNSGLMGRQTQQLQALQSLVQNVTQGHNVDNSQLNSIAALQGVFASSGNRSLQGQAGADMLSQMNNGFQQGFFNPQMRLIMGAGTKFQGMSGMWQLQKQMNAGVMGPDGLKNLQTMYNFAKVNGGNNADAQNEAASMFAHQAGMNLTTDQIQGFMDLGRKNKLTEKNVKAFEANSKATGKKLSDKNSKSYQKSDAATNNQSEATADAQAKALYDNTKWLRTLNNTLGKLPWYLYGVSMAAGALTGMLAGTLGSFGFTTIIKKIAMSKFGSSIGNLAETSMGQRLRTKFFGSPGASEDTPRPPGTPPTKPGEAPPGFHDANDETRAENERIKFNEYVPPKIQPNINPRTGTNTTRLGSFISGAKKIGGGFKSAGGDVLKFFSENPMGKAISKGASGLWSLAGKLATPLAVAGGIYHVATAKKGEHVKATGEAAGNVGGMLAGAKVGAGLGARIGAGIGSFIGPEGTLIGAGIGTVAGTVIGGVTGSKVGQGIGGWIGGMGQKAWNGVTGLFSPSHAKAAELPKGKSNKTKDQQDQHSTNTKARTEDKRTYNIQNESANLSINSKQLTQMEQLLATARQQNGIVGTLTGAGGGGMTGAGGAAGMTNAKGNQASIWNYFAQQGYSSNAISGIMGNIGTETGGTFDPTTQQKGGPGMGLAQWTQGQRWSQLQAWAKQNGMDPMAMNTQLQFMSKEMNSMGLTPQSMNGMSVGQATSAFEQQYEGAGTPNMSSRNNYANQAYSQFANSPQATANVSTGTNNTHTINSSINVNLTANGDAASQVASNSQLQNIGQKLQQMIYGSMGFYSTETNRA